MLPAAFRAIKEDYRETRVIRVRWTASKLLRPMMIPIVVQIGLISFAVAMAMPCTGPDCTYHDGTRWGWAPINEAYGEILYSGHFSVIAALLLLALLWWILGIPDFTHKVWTSITSRLPTIRW